ncbi:MAG: serine O-acetyltransferase [Phycisphaerales bacterium]
MTKATSGTGGSNSGSAPPCETPRAPGQGNASDAGRDQAQRASEEARQGVLASTIPELLRSVDRLQDIARVHGLPLPRIAGVHEMVELTRRIVFVGYFDRHEIPAEGLEEHLRRLTLRVWELAEEAVAAGLRHDRGVCEAEGDAFTGCHADASRIASRFIESLPRLRESVALDVRAAFEGDPAARSVDEIVLCYPGIDAVFAYRVAHLLHEFGAAVAPRIITELAHSRTGVDIHPGARIGRSFFLDHGTGVVIGETAEIGDDVRIYQGVTLGARSFPRDGEGRMVRGTKRHPTIGNRVTIYADAVILGGDTVVGDDCVVSGSVFLTQSVPPGHVVRSKQPELTMRTNRDQSVQRNPAGA